MRGTRLFSRQEVDSPRGARSIDFGLTMRVPPDRQMIWHGYSTTVVHEPAQGEPRGKLESPRLLGGRLGLSGVFRLCPGLAEEKLRFTSLGFVSGPSERSTYFMGVRWFQKSLTTGCFRLVTRITP